MTNDKLELSKADVDAIIDYIFLHARASPKGRGYKVWERMLAFQNQGPDVTEQDGDKSHNES